MDPNDVAAQKHWDAISSQQMLVGMTDDPDQFREQPLTGIFKHAWRERFGHGGSMDYESVKF
jgi:hypothetical protein